MIIEILKKGKSYKAQFDSDFVNDKKLYIDNVGYVCYRVGPHMFKRIHNELMPSREGFIVDHIDRDKLNNQSANLRYVTRTENNNNKEAKGYYWDDSRKRFRAVIVLDGKRKGLGQYTNEEDARKAYQSAHVAAHGKFSPYYEEVG